jgi:hypothetical protein
MNYTQGMMLLFTHNQSHYFVLLNEQNDICCSGPVTGGVLRGEKGRFQLFGDTMNTAGKTSIWII